jgi:tRNA G26 N,N-dimethylase Trm1
MPINSEEKADILIFKTNLRFKKDLRKISTSIQGDPRIKIWHVDVWDIDKVLRIESVDIKAKEIIQMVKHAGYQCEELPD